MESVFSWSEVKTIAIPSSSVSTLRLYVGFWGILRRQMRSITLNLPYCTTIFTTRFPPWSLPGVGNGGGKRQFVTPGHSSDPGSNMGKRDRLTRKTRPSASSHVIPDPGHPTPRRWKRLRIPTTTTTTTPHTPPLSSPHTHNHPTTQPPAAAAPAPKPFPQEFPLCCAFPARKWL